MKISEFLAFLRDKNIALNAIISPDAALSVSPKVAWASKIWNKVKKDISAHYFGAMPEAIKEAFPNETPKQQLYRERVFSSATKGLLHKAISDTNRVVMSPQFTISYGDKLAAWFAENPAPFDGVNTFLGLKDYLANVVYQERVKDPNAHIVTLPTNRPSLVKNSAGEWVSNPAELGQPMGVKVMIYPSQSLVYQDNNLFIFAEPQVPDYATFYNTLAVQVFYRVVTPNSSFLYNPVGSNNGEQFLEYYEENRKPKQYLPVMKTGGKFMSAQVAASAYSTGITIGYYESDFSYAVPIMLDADRLKSQLDVITNATVFPMRAERPIACRADGCRDGRVQHFNQDGTPKINENGTLQTSKCGTCEGTGLMNVGAQDKIVVPELSFFDEGTARQRIPLEDFIKIFPPDTSAVIELRTQATEKINELRNQLSIIQQKMVGQSEGSKEADEQDKYPLLHQVATGMANIGTSVLKSMVFYVVEPQFWEQELAQIHIATPTSFKLYGADALRAMRDTSRELKDLHTRAIESLVLLESESNDPQKIREREVWQAYTRDLCEASMMELDGLAANGDIDKKTKLAALLGGQEIARILQENPTIENSAIFKELDKIFGKLAEIAELRITAAAAMSSAFQEQQSPIPEPPE